MANESTPAATETRMNPCPFCGCKGSLSFFDGFWIAGCDAGQENADDDVTCRANVICFHHVTPEGAIAAWNRRAPVAHTGEPVEIVAAEMQEYNQRRREAAPLGEPERARLLARLDGKLRLLRERWRSGVDGSHGSAERKIWIWAADAEAIAALLRAAPAQQPIGTCNFAVGNSLPCMHALPCPVHGAKQGERDAEDVLSALARLRREVVHVEAILRKHLSSTSEETGE